MGRTDGSGLWRMGEVVDAVDGLIYLCHGGFEVVTLWYLGICYFGLVSDGGPRRCADDSSNSEGEDGENGNVVCASGPKDSDIRICL